MSPAQFGLLLDPDNARVTLADPAPHRPCRRPEIESRPCLASSIYALDVLRL